MNRRDLIALAGAGLTVPPYASSAAGITKRVFDLHDYGARGDGKTKDTAAIQSAIEAAFKAGGGTVYAGSGSYLTGGIVLKDNITFYLDAGATLLGSTDLADYKPHPGPNPHSDVNVHHLIFARGATNLALCGLGRIDGEGRAFWVPSKRKQIPEDFWRESVSNTFRPVDHDARPSPMLEFVQCKNLRIEGVTIANSAGWTMRPIECESVYIHSIRVRNPITRPNTDGMDVTCCRNVFIDNCDISTGDDVICIKSITPYGGEPSPTKNITITNCVLTGCCNGFKIGTGTRGAFENIMFTNSVIYNEDVPLNRRNECGIAIEMVDGGSVEGIVVSNIRMQNTRTPIFVRLGNRSGNPPEGPKPGALRGVIINNVYATGAVLTSSVTGLPGHDVEDVTLSNIRIDTVEKGQLDWINRQIPEVPRAYPSVRMFGRLPAYGFYCRHVSGLRFENVRIEARKTDPRPLLVCDDVKQLEAAGLNGSAPAGEEPLFLFRNVQHAFIRGCYAPPGVGTFLGAEGSGTSDISLISNDLSGAAHAAVALQGAPEDAISLAGNRASRG
ncbi:MAG: glycoside hydrolase family 28 protein [Terriglobia bacterium]